MSAPEYVRKAELEAQLRQAEHRAANTNGVAVPAYDPVDKPKHYNTHPSGVECITITEHMNFCRGNAMKYLWRAGEKGSVLEDLRKARWYLDREIARLAAAQPAPPMLARAGAGTPCAQCNRQGGCGCLIGALEDSRCGERFASAAPPCDLVRGHASPHDFRGKRR